MTNSQKTIKWIVTAFAILLSISIIVSIINVVMGIVGFRSWNNKDYQDITAKVTGEVISLDIDNDFGKLVFVEGDEFKIQGTQVSEDFVWKLRSNGVLEVKNTTSGWGFLRFINFGSSNNKDTVLEITIPSGYEFDKVTLDTGVGSVDISGINTKKLELDMGTGKCSGENIIADKVDLNAGVGNIVLEKVEFGDMDVDAGVGDIVLDGEFYGESSIDAGVGSIHITIIGAENDYDISNDPGVGGVYINGDKVGELNHTNRAALYSFDLNGGVGKISLDFVAD